MFHPISLVLPKETGWSPKEKRGGVMRTSTAAHWALAAKPGPVVPGLASRSRVPRRVRRGRPGTRREGEAPTEAERLRYRNEAPRHLPPFSTARGRVARAQALSAEHRATLEQKPRGQTRRAPPGLDTEKAYDVRRPARLLRSSGRGAGARFSGKGRRKAG